MCDLLLGKEQESATRFVGHRCQGAENATSLLELCSLHRAKIKEILRSDPLAVGPLKRAVSQMLRQLGSYPKASRSLWKRRPRSRFSGCPLCWALRSEEEILCKSLIHFLDEMDFWKQLQLGPVLCASHLEKCLALGNGAKGFSRLLRDQAAKLDNLMDDLVRLEATGRNEKCKSNALEWLADSKASTLETRLAQMPAGYDKTQTDLFPDPNNTPSSVGKDQEAERLLFENEKVRRKVEDLTQLLGKAESRAASLHYRVAELSEANKILEMNCTGANTLANGLEKMVKNLRQEIETLKEEKLPSPPKQIP